MKRRFRYGQALLSIFMPENDGTNREKEKNIPTARTIFPFLIVRIWAGAKLDIFHPTLFVLANKRQRGKFSFNRRCSHNYPLILLSPPIKFDWQWASVDGRYTLKIKLRWKLYPLCKPRKSPELYWEKVRGTIEREILILSNRSSTQRWERHI